MKKTMMFLVAAIFLMSTVCLGAKVDPTKVAVPRDSGRIIETYVSPKADAPVIAYVQDIHVNYEAQKAEVNVLEALIRDYGFDLVFVEGKPQDSTKDLKAKREKHSQQAKEIAAENLLKEGSIYGIEYLDLVSNYNFTIQGIEDMAIYKTEYNDLMKIYGATDEMSKLVAALQNIANNLKLHIYTKEMRDLDGKIAAYDKDEIGLIEYVKFLETAAKANNINVKTMLNLSLFIDSANLEGQINFPAVETERQTVFTTAEKALTGKAKEDLTAANLKFRTGDMSQAQFYTYLKGAAGIAKIDLTPHKNLALYTQYITTYEKIDTTILFKEIDQLVEKIKTASIKTPEQKKLSQIDKGLSIISDFVNTKLIPDEYNYYIQNKAGFDLKGWLTFLKTNSANFKLTTPVPDNVSVIEANMPVLENFYSVSFDRDEAFIRNIASNLQKYGKDKAILITGGFHTVNMKKLLKDNGYSYVVIAPRVDIIKDYSGAYKNNAKLNLDYVNSAVKNIQPAVNPANTKNMALPSQVEAGELSIDAALAKADELAAQAPDNAQIQQAKAKVRDILDNMKDKGWLGEKLTPEQEKAVRDALTETGVAQTATLAEPIVVDIRDVIAQQAQAEGLQAGQINIPQIRVIPQARMPQGIRGPVVIDGVVVIGDKDLARFGAMPQMWGHEIAAFHSASMVMPGDDEARHEFAKRVEARMIDRIPDATTRYISQDAQQAYLAMGQVQDCKYVEFALSNDLNREHGKIVDEHVAFLRANGVEVDVKYSLPPGTGTVRATAYQSRGGAQLGRSQVTIAPSANAHRLPGVMNLGLVCANLQAQPNNQRLREIAADQFRALTGQNLDLPANPDDLIKRVQDISVTLPAPATVNFNRDLEQERTQQIFRVAA